jgi:hypothetical protein
MTRLMVAVAGLAALAACSERRGTDIADAGRPDRPLEEALADSTDSTRSATSPRPGADQRPLQVTRQSGRSRAPAPPPTSTPIPSRSPGPDTTPLPADRPAPDSNPPPPAHSPPPPRTAWLPAGVVERVLPVGTTVRAVLQDSINSRHDSAGEVVMARINADITDRSGQVVVPAESPFQLSIAQLEPAKSRNAADGKLVLRVDSVFVEGRAYWVSGDVQAVPHELRGRGVTAGEAGKVGVGAAAGAVVGRVLGGNTRGAVIGGVVGAAGGAAVAAQTARRDVVVKPGTWVSFVLTAPLVVRR